jgi:hypothetical protein
VSQKNVAIVPRSFEIHDSGGVEAALQFFASDVAWYTSDQWQAGAVYRGQLRDRDSNPKFDIQSVACCQLHHPGSRVQG